LKNIGVERDLTNVINYLERQGYKVQEFESAQKNNKDFIDGFDAVVVSGMDENIMGIESTMAKTSIIDARGMRPEDIKQEIERRIK
jgi:galactitol-specific phosphotransferase system IIB component